MKIVAQRSRHASLKEKLLALTHRRGSDECWPWLGSSANFGKKGDTPRVYGRCFFDGVMHYAHRATYEQFVGPIPVGLTVDHACFNTLCQNPAHLEPVTRVVNSRRYQENKRLPSGGRTMLTPAQQAEIAALYRYGSLSQSEIARRFGVDQSHVSRLVRKAS